MIDRKFEMLKYAAFLTLMFAAIVAGAWADSPIDPAMCTTDSDCAERFGGDGGPMPLLPEEEELIRQYLYELNEYVTWQDV
jgi:hypothetical protein